VSDEETSPDDIRDSVYISLCQNHLPKLADAGVVGYDSAEKTVGPGPAFPVVERHLRADTTGDGDGVYTSYYALVSLATLLVLGGSAYVLPAVQSYGVPTVLAIHALAVVATGRRLLSRQCRLTSADLRCRSIGRLSMGRTRRSKTTDLRNRFPSTVRTGH